MFDVIRQATLVALWFGLCAWALGRGGPPERLSGATHMIAAILTPALQYNIGRSGAELGVLAVDMIVVGIAIFAALRWDRWWTLYAAGFLVCQALTHVVRLYNLEIDQFYYASAAMFWSYASLHAMAFGVGQLEWERWKRWRISKTAGAGA